MGVELIKRIPSHDIVAGIRIRGSSVYVGSIAIAVDTGMRPKEYFVVPNFYRGRRSESTSIERVAHKISVTKTAAGPMAHGNQRQDSQHVVSLKQASRHC
jgi:hypothetical protein